MKRSSRTTARRMTKKIRAKRNRKRHLASLLKMQRKMANAKPVALTTAQLKALCDRAEALGFANGPDERFWQDVDPNGRHVAGDWFRHRPYLEFWQGVEHSFNFDHNGGVNIRAVVLCKLRGRVMPVTLRCDFDEPQFMGLVSKAK